jgi:hypothetical protein
MIATTNPSFKAASESFGIQFVSMRDLREQWVGILIRRPS